MFVMIAGVAANATNASFLKSAVNQINICNAQKLKLTMVRLELRGKMQRHAIFGLISGVIVYTLNASFLKDARTKTNVWDDCRCGCIRRKRIIFEGCPE